MKKKILSILIIATMICTALPAMVFADTEDIATNNDYTVYNSATLELVKPETDKAVKWSTSKKAVATVSKKGVVTGLKAGKCKITAKFGKEKQVYNITVPATYEGFDNLSNFGALYGKKNTLGNLDQAGMEKLVKKFVAKEYVSIFASMVDLTKVNYAGYNAKNAKEATKLVNQYTKKLKKGNFVENKTFGLWSDGTSVVFVNKDKKKITVAYMNKSDLGPFAAYL